MINLIKTLLNNKKIIKSIVFMLGFIVSLILSLPPMIIWGFALLSVVAAIDLDDKVFNMISILSSLNLSNIMSWPAKSYSDYKARIKRWFYNKKDISEIQRNNAEKIAESRKILQECENLKDEIIGIEKRNDKKLEKVSNEITEIKRIQNENEEALTDNLNKIMEENKNIESNRLEINDLYLQLEAIESDQKDAMKQLNKFLLLNRDPSSKEPKSISKDWSALTKSKSAQKENINPSHIVTKISLAVKI